MSSSHSKGNARESSRHGSSKNKPKVDQSQYSYSAMSNLVTQADRRFVTRRDVEPTGEPESLANRINISEMGVRARVERETTLESGMLKEVQDRDLSKKTKQSAAPQGPAGISVNTSLLSSTDNFETLNYRPLTDDTREAYDYMLSFTHHFMGEESPDVIRSALDLIIEYLKDEKLDDAKRKRSIEEVLGSSIDDTQYSQVENLAKRLTDYGLEEDNEEETVQLNEQGIPVVFNENEEDVEAALDEESVGEEDDNDVLVSKEQTEAEKGVPTPVDNEVTVIKGDNHEEPVVPILHPRDVDAFWLQRELSKVYQDAHVGQEKTQKAFQLLSTITDTGELENSLMELFDYEHFELVQLLVSNRPVIVWCTRLLRAKNEEERQMVENALLAAGQSAILARLRGVEENEDEEPSLKKQKTDTTEVSGSNELPESSKLKPAHEVDLENYVFREGARLMSNKSVKLPEGSYKRTGKGYEEIHVPAPEKKPMEPNEKLVPITDMPEWTHEAFTGTQTLNRIQSKIFPTAFKTDENLLICAPTGAGKTNVAMLCILSELAKYRNEATGNFATDQFKIVYIAPLKALVQEMVTTFGTRLAPYGITVSELTGDRQLTKQQISSTQIIVTTPEKWDIITRKSNDLSYTNLVRLVIIDEIHLLHDERGPVLESIVSRIIRHEEESLERVRLVGLSATLPNYVDVAAFLRVQLKNGLFYFDSSYRPCPLQQEFIGVTEKKPIKRLQVLNEACYEKVMEHAGKNQVLIFVHSRKETAKTARFIRDKALEEETIGHLLRSDAASREILRAEADTTKNEDLKDLLPYGFAIHHAGMRREDRRSAEDLFADGTVQVLVSTATLAWGVNLPAHTVIIKGTQVYSPEKGRWAELSPQDVLQMLGRAGRPQFDSYGEGIIITTHSELQYYLSLMNQQLPIESQYMSKLPDNLNAEIATGTIQSIADAVRWLGYTYLYIRMLRSPALYNVGPEYADDTYLIQKRVDLIHAAAVILEKCKLIVYNRDNGTFNPTELGKVASSYYISNTSMDTYNKMLNSTVSLIELFRVFSLSEEFKYIPVREEEKVELTKLMERVPIPVRESVNEAPAKINVLLQSYISRQSLEGFALISDMVYVTQSAGRIMRAIFEIALRRNWASVAKLALDISKMIDKRMWSTMSPLRQFPHCPTDVIRRVEKKDFPWHRYFDLDPAELGELIGVPKEGRRVYSMVHSFPRLNLDAHLQPVTRSLLRVELLITANFNWDDAFSSQAESFWIFVEDVDGERLLHYEYFVLLKKYSEDEHIVTFTIPLVDPLPPNYFVSIVSDRWLHCSKRIPVSFMKLIMPEKFPPPTQLLSLQPTSVEALKIPEFVSLYAPKFSFFNKVQTQVFNTIYGTSETSFIGAPNGSGKTTCAELALLRHWSQEDTGAAVYLAPFEEIVELRFAEWKPLFEKLGKAVLKLTGERSRDLRSLQVADLILATPAQWDVFSKRWRQTRVLHNIDLFICDELQMLGGLGGPTYETCVLRVRYMAAQMEKHIRIIGLAVSLANARDLGEWLGASPQNIYNFSPKDRPNPLTIRLQSYSITHFPSLMLAMTKPTYQILRSSFDKQKTSIVYVPDKSVLRQLALDLVTFAISDGDERFFAPNEIPLLDSVKDKALLESLQHGVGFLSEITSTKDKAIMEHLFLNGIIRVLLISHDAIYATRARSDVVVIMGTQFYDGKEHRYIDYPISDILQMLGVVSNQNPNAFGEATLMTVTSKKEYYKKFLNEALPIESHLQLGLHDAFVSEIASQTIENKQDAVDWLTWTYMYRRLVANPAFYGLTDISHEAISEYLSELVENTMSELNEARLIAIDDEDDSCYALNLGMIASYYNITYITMQTFALSLTAKTRMKGLLEIISSAAEYEILPIRKYEDIILDRIHRNLPVRLSAPNYQEPHCKAFILLAAHFSRFQLPANLVLDQKTVLKYAHRLLSACVDTLSSDNHLNASIRPMEMSQMVTQAVWDRDSPLKQIPHFTDERIARCNAANVNDVFDIIDLDDDKRTELLQMDNAQLAQCAEFINKYPDIDIDFELQEPDNVRVNAPSVLVVQLSRELEEDETADTTVCAPFFPFEKTEHWWLVLSDGTNLLAIKKITLNRVLTSKLQFVPLQEGEQKLKLSCFSDSYVGVDYEKEFSCKVMEALDEEMQEEEE
ncbi:U5 snRNP complex subunit Brr2 [Schizosaccharomyces japonicus yFS275]|uniref:RNA helicase n=1 Tax=Schizosaccharomyces japonicus (strain yFS275 / FY16936) TaxID=402676 RepID=B6K231_SCHJY|nr:U5 snRNP complex subunit Brr2 [Schizosaccharomyces japonicus yFS275]EEB07212.1 U5 snRNP complex subunit Brr2 [Schizosaccharomyces japonicus yFS275]